MNAMHPRRIADVLRHGARLLLATFLIAAGFAHLVAGDEFYAQVPSWMPWPAAVIAISGIIEIMLGIAVLMARKRRQTVGLAVMTWFAVIVVGNVYQAVAGIDAFGLTSDVSRWSRVASQPLLIVWAWWATRPDRREQQS